MSTYVALLRAVNVGGTCKLAMRDLSTMCEAAGFAKIKTYIASGNVVFDSEADECSVKAALERALEIHFGKPAAVLVRTAAEMAAVRDANPFPNAPGNRVVVTFLETPLPRDALDFATNVRGEQIALRGREIYICYDEMGVTNSKLNIPDARSGTGRNMNTVAALATMSAAL